MVALEVQRNKDLRIVCIFYIDYVSYVSALALDHQHRVWGFQYAWLSSLQSSSPGVLDSDSPPVREELASSQRHWATWGHFKTYVHSLTIINSFKKTAFVSFLLRSIFYTKETLYLNGLPFILMVIFFLPISEWPCPGNSCFLKVRTMSDASDTVYSSVFFLIPLFIVHHRFLGNNGFNQKQIIKKRHYEIFHEQKVWAYMQINAQRILIFCQ